MFSVLVAQQNEYDKHTWLVGDEITPFYQTPQEWAEYYFKFDETTVRDPKPELKLCLGYLEGINPRTVYGADLYKVENTPYYVYIWKPKSALHKMVGAY